jgi:hypothetical protein
MVEMEYFMFYILFHNLHTWINKQQVDDKSLIGNIGIEKDLDHWYYRPSYCAIIGKEPQQVPRPGVDSVRRLQVAQKQKRLSHLCPWGQWQIYILNPFLFCPGVEVSAFRGTLGNHPIQQPLFYPTDSVKLQECLGGCCWVRNDKVENQERKESLPAKLCAGKGVS